MSSHGLVRCSVLLFTLVLSSASAKAESYSMDLSTAQATGAELRVISTAHPTIDAVVSKNLHWLRDRLGRHIRALSPPAHRRGTVGRGIADGHGVGSDGHDGYGASHRRRRPSQPGAREAHKDEG